MQIQLIQQRRSDLVPDSWCERSIKFSSDRCSYKSYFMSIIHWLRFNRNPRRGR